MSEPVLSAELLSRMAGWQVVKTARGLLAAGAVRESNWSPPRLTGRVHAGGNTFPSGLVIHSMAHVETLCSCRPARQEGTICAHAVAVALHALQPAAPLASSPPPPAPLYRLRTNTPVARPPAGRRLTRAAPDAGGEPIELHVTLPPNFVEAAHRGKAMLVFEAQRGGRRVPLNTLPPATPFHLDPADTRLLEEVERLAGEPAGLLVLPVADLARLLPQLTGHPRVTLGKSQPLVVTANPLRVALHATLQTDGEIVLTLAQPLPPTFAAGESVWALAGNELAPVSLPAVCHGIRRGPLRLTRAQVPAFLSQEWAGLLAAAEVTADFRVEDFTLTFQQPTFQLRLTGGLARLDAELWAVYGPSVCQPGKLAAGEPPWVADAAAHTRYTARDLAAEQAAQAVLLRAGFGPPNATGQRRLEGEDAVLSFFARDFPRLQREWSVTLEERLQRSTETKLERIEPAFRVTPTGERWFELQMGFAAAGGEQFAPADIQRLILSGRRHARLKNGRLGLLDTDAVEEFQQALLDCNPRQSAGRYQIDSAQAGFITATLRDQPTWSVQAPAAWRERARVQAGAVNLDCPPLGALETVLRPYQKHGVGWLWFLRRNGFGGILADEMGLGKTLQTLAFIQSCLAHKMDPGAPAPTLVICPTSLVHNWVLEAGRFTPGLRVLALHGADRHLQFDRIPQSDLVVSSYALVRRDAERYRDVEFDLVVLDEAQHIKNRTTQNAQAVKSMRARHRLVLTGTPLENSVLDLWSIFDFLMPGYLGAARDFRERYEVPISRERDLAAQTRLARRVRPFLLRRLKREVAAELPAKIEQVAFCDLTAPQAAVYRQLLEAGRREVLEAVGQQGLAKSRMVVLTTLLRLRQACCDLRLLKLPDLDPHTTSGKLDLFAELLEEVIDGGHRVLVFSQFTTMLALLQERLAAEEVAFCQLDGSTPNRAEVVQRFQNRPDIPVFLISLKAGGTGLNLTGADTVIHFDPWWNPAVEAQATDRAHRLGQTRVVTSYKLITRGTVEEKILRLQERKREAAHALLADEEQLAGALSGEELQELLAG